MDVKKLTHQDLVARIRIAWEQGKLTTDEAYHTLNIIKDGKLMCAQSVRRVLDSLK